MENGKHQVYEFGGFQLDPARHALLRHGQPVALTPKLFETLVLLVENRDRTLPKDEMMQALWAETFVEEGNLSQNIFLLRKALGDDRNGHSFIHTIPRKGYRFVAPVVETESEVCVLLPGGRDASFWKDNSPFRSLTVFEPQDAWLFFGREAETAELVERVARSPVVVVIGNSGSGKSSLLRAGLIPALCDGKFPHANGSGAALPGDSWRIAVVRPSASPFDYLAEVLPGQLAPDLAPKELAELIADCRVKLPERGDALRNAITALASAAGNGADDRQSPRSRLLLVVDQFEELFTLTARPALRDRYIDALLAAAECGGAVRVHVVLALRADFFGHCLDHPDLRRHLEASLFTLGSMTAEQMRETIEKRLALAGGRAEPGLIDALLEDVGAEPGNLALLEHALGQLWEQCGGAGCTFTNFAYNRMGRLRGALGRHADAVFQSLSDDDQRRLALRIFLELVHLGEGAQDTRRRVAKAELLKLADPSQIEQLLAQLASSRLIATGREGEETFVEVSHEALIREWPALRQWLEENREELALGRRLAQAAEEWESLKRDRGALLQGARLAQAEDWLGRHQDANDSLRAYVQTSVDARNESARREREGEQRELSRQKQTARRFRWFSYALSVLLLIAVGSAWFAYHQRILEKSRAMAGQAEGLAAIDRGQALDLAIRGWQTANTEEARRAVMTIFPDPLITLTREDAVYTTLFSPDGERIVSVGRGRNAELWNVRDGSLVATLTHEASVEDVAFSPDGRHIATTSDDGTARLWNGTTGRLIAVLRGHRDKAWRVNFAPDGTRVVTTSLDHTARIWSTDDGNLLMILKGHSEPVYDAKFSPDGTRIVTASWDKTARVWNAATGRTLAVCRGHSGGLFRASFSPDGQRVGTASYDGTARIWDSADGRLLLTLHHQGPVNDILFSRDGRRIVSASSDDTARIWNASDGALQATLLHDGPVQQVEFSRDERWIATASLDRTARVWSSEGRLLAILRGHSREVYNAAFSPSSELIVTSSGDHSAKIWNLRAGRTRILVRHNSPVETVVFSPDDRLLATGADDHLARTWNPLTGQLRFELRGHSGDVRRIVFSQDGQRIATASADNTVRVWSSQDGNLLAVLQGHTAPINDVSFSPSGLEIVTASEDRTARLWDARDGRALVSLRGHTDGLFRARYFPDGRRILTSDGRTARIWNCSSGQLLATLENRKGSVHDAVLAPNGDSIATGSDDGSVRLWSGNGRLLKVLHAPSGVIWQIGFSKDGRYVLAVALDRTVRVWNVTDGSLRSILRGHSDRIVNAAFSPDGRQIVTSDMDQTARVWNTEDGRVLASLQGHSGWLMEARFSNSSKQVITSSIDQTARIWEILTLDDIERILSK